MSPSRVRLPIAAAVTGLALLVFFDLGPALALNDDFTFAWSVGRMAHGHGLENLHDFGVLHLPQTIFAYAVTLGHDDARLLRLSALPFVLMTSAAIAAAARRLDASPFWAAVAAATPLTMPISLTVAASFMTDFFYLGLLMMAALFAMEWVSRGNRMLPAIALGISATLERPHGVFLAAALTAAFAVTWRRSPVRSRDLLGLAVLWAGCGAAIATPFLLGFTSLQYFHQGPGAGGVDFGILVAPAAGIPSMTVMVAAPLVLAQTRARSSLDVLRRPALSIVFAVIVLAWALITIIGSQIVANQWTWVGLGAGTVPGHKPAVAFLAIGRIAAILVASLLPLILALRNGILPGWRGTGGNEPSTARTPVRLEPAVVLLVALGLLHLLPLTVSPPYDRYYLAVIFPVLPVLAREASAVRNDGAARWAVLCMVIGLALFVVGEQDYFAWQEARTVAVRQLSATVDPLTVNAGYEANAVYGALPSYEAHGTFPIHHVPGENPRDQTIAFLLSGPDDPAYTLCVVSAAAAGKGVNYWSLAPGKIITVRGAVCP
jgi:hypothetical protein